MTKELGKIFKLIRESKGLSQKEVAGDVISLAQLSRFERGVSGLNVDSFYLCLRNMSVPLDEFQYVYHNYTQDRDVRFSTELSEAYLEKNIIKLRKILQDCQELIEKNPINHFYKLNKIVVEAVIFYLDQEATVPQKDIKYLMDYLFSVEEWGRYELWLYTNSIGLMTLSSLETFTSEMVKRTQFYKGLPENRKRILQMLLNVVGTCLDKGHTQAAFKFLHQVEQFRNTETDIYETVLFKYYKGFYAYRIGNENGIADKEKCVETMTYLECYGIARQMEESIKKIKEEV